MKREKSGTPDVEEISIRPLHSINDKFRDVFYYRIILSSRVFDTAVCIVLMDGTVLKPVDLAEEQRKAKK
jgi:hypothetical protein